MNTQLLLITSISVDSNTVATNGSVFDNADSGFPSSWVTPENAELSDDIYSTVSLGLFNPNSKYLTVTGFGFSLSVRAVVLGIKIDIERSTAIGITDYSIKIIKGGSISGDEKATATAWAASDQYDTYGSSTDLWGLTWSASDINGSDFGIAIAAHRTSGAGTAKIDHVRTTVYYSIAGYATSGTIDLYGDIPISLNYNIADIKEPQKRNADYSKTVTCPGSNNNNKLLAHIYEIGVDRLFNPNKKVEARVVYDSAQVFKGYMRLAKIRKLRDDKIEYDLELIGRLADLFANIQDAKLTDLEWSDLDHTYNRANQIASWSTPVGSNYVYPFVDYGYSNKYDEFDVNHLFPAVYIKEAWDRIFQYAGFQYSSSFLTSTYFKSLIMPFTGEAMRLTDTQIAAREFQASRLTTNQTHVPFSTSGTIEYFNNIFNDDSTNPNIDTGANYNTATGVYTVPANGFYNFTSVITIGGVATPSIPNQYIVYLIRVFPRLIVNGIARYGGQYYLQFPVGIVSTAQTITATNVQITWSGFLTVGQTVYLDYQAVLQPNPGANFLAIGVSDNVNYQLRLDTGSYLNAKVEAVIKDGDTVSFSNTLPAEMKARDFVMSITKMHNLYFEYDKDIPNKIYIEPRNDYYNNKIQNWSKRLDASREPEIIPMGALNAKRYRFTYKDDGDVLNKTYKTTYGETYAEKHTDIDNDFLKNTETMDVLFSPTPQYHSAGGNRFYPAMFNVDSSLKIVHNKSMNPRILYYGGLISCGNWYLTSNLAKGAALTTYPYCGMMDNPTAPTISLDFGAPKEVFYVPAWQGSYTNNNLYNKYWKQFIDEITDYNSSIVTAWFWLKPVDIMEVDFRHVYHFLGQNFRLNKIYDYNPSELSLTKCEFIKIKVGIPFVSGRKFITGGRGIVFDGTSPTPVPFAPQLTTAGGNNNGRLDDHNNIIGNINYISPTSTGVLIIGDANSVGEDAHNITIQNSSGCIVAGGLVNVSILNSSGITVTESNTVIENGVIISSQSTGISSYKKYIAILNQSGTSAPTAVVIENTLGGTVVWTYSSAGIYLGTLNGAFTVNKTIIFIGTGEDGNFFTSPKVYRSSSNEITINTNVGNDYMINVPIEIRVYA